MSQTKYFSFSTVASAVFKHLPDEFHRFQNLSYAVANLTTRFDFLGDNVVVSIARGERIGMMDGVYRYLFRIALIQKLTAGAEPRRFCLLFVMNPDKGVVPDWEENPDEAAVAQRQFRLSTLKAQRRQLR